MLTRVDVTNILGQTLSFPLDDISGGYSVEDISGLDPVKATLVSSSFATKDGEQFHTARRESRNIQLKLGYEPDYVDTTVESLRKQLYDFFMPKTTAILNFYDSDDSVYNISSKVEEFDSPLFTDEPAGTASLMCYDPDFLDPVSKRFTGLATSVVAVSMGADTLIAYPGTVETGILVTITAVQATTALSIDIIGPDGVQKSLVVSGLSLVAGDVVTISTVPGNKYVTLTHSGATSSILYLKSVTSPWLTLSKGNNHLRVYTGDGGAMPFTVDYTVRYGGL